MEYNSFSVKPLIKVNPEHKKKPFVLLNNIAYLSAKNENVYRIEIHKGYNWNGANIPRFLWRIVGSQYDPQFLPASMVHDWLCENKDFIMNDGVKVSSDIFRDILILYKVPEWKAKTMATAVRLFQMTQKGWR